MVSNWQDSKDTYVVLGVVKSYRSFAALLVSLLVGPWVRFLHLQPKNGSKKAGSPRIFFGMLWDARERLKPLV